MERKEGERRDGKERKGNRSKKERKDERSGEKERKSEIKFYRKGINLTGEKKGCAPSPSTGN